MRREPGTRVKDAIDLREGDVIVAPDGTEHTVTSWFSMPGNSVTFSTNTGLRLHKTWFEALNDRYDVKTAVL